MEIWLRLLTQYASPRTLAEKAYCPPMPSRNIRSHRLPSDDPARLRAGLADDVQQIGIEKPPAAERVGFADQVRLATGSTIGCVALLRPGNSGWNT